LKFSTCNEMFEGWNWGDVCEVVSRLGYDGVEVAPFTFCEDVRELTTADRRRIQDQARAEGLEVCGLHWLLVKPEGMALLSLDSSVRTTTRDYLLSLVDMCADIGGKVLTLGSPNQRSIPQGMLREDGLGLLVESLRVIGDQAAERCVTFCLEPLPASMTNIMNTAEDTLEIVRQVNHPAVGMMLDVKSMCSEGRRPEEIIRSMSGRFSHFHANDANMRAPGTGDVDFVPIMEALIASEYSDHVSVEVFDYSPDPVTIAEQSIRYMKACLELARSS